ncbi:MAG: rhodoquinone biosynthesis methyltransferase RquA [Woeseia sp.]
MEYTEIAGSTGESFQETGIAPVPRQLARAPAGIGKPRIPDYLRKTYYWAYLNPRNVKLLDREWVVRTILWQQHRRLAQAAIAEIEPGQHVMQTACVYGDFSSMLAAHIGPEGKLEVFDVAEVQVRNCRRKLAGYGHAIVRHEDVLYLRDETFDVVCCYFLMHEMPGDYKRGVADTLLDAVRPGGKLVFVDYHKPHWAHPLKLITSLVFDTLEPYAKELWRTEIAAFAHRDARFSWQKETYFGGLFQKVVATHKN